MQADKKGAGEAGQLGTGHNSGLGNAQGSGNAATDTATPARPATTSRPGPGGSAARQASAHLDGRTPRTSHKDAKVNVVGCTYLHQSVFMLPDFACL